MLKLSSKLLLFKRKIFFIIILSISLSFLFMFCLIFATSNILNSQKELSYLKYGDFKSALYSLTNEEEQIVHNNFKPSDIGSITMYGTVPFKNLELSVGYMSENALNLSNINLKYGTMPKNNDEIVVEEFVANNLNIDNNNINSYIEIGKKKVKVVGILQNYSSNFSVPANLTKGMNTFPNILTNENTVLFSSPLSKNFLINNHNVISFDGRSNITNAYNTYTNLGIDYNKIHFNDKLINNGFLNYSNYFYWSITFFIIIFICSLFCSFSSVSFLYKDYRKKFSVLKSIGATKSDIVKIILSQMSVIFLTSAVIAVPLFIVTSFLIKTYLNIQQIDIKNIIQVFLMCSLAFVVVFIFTLILLFIKLFKTLNSNSISLNIKNNYERILIKNKRSYIRHFSNKNTFLLIFMLILTSMSIFISVYLYNTLTFKTDGEYIDYVVSAKHVKEQEIYNNYEFESNPNSYISYNKLDTIKKIKDIDFIETTPYLKSSSILIDKSNPVQYFNDWLNAYKVENSMRENSLLNNNLPKEMNNFTFIPNINFVTVDDKNLDEIIKQFNLNINKSEFTNNKNVLLFAPNISENDKTKILNNPLYIGGIYNDNNKVKFQKDSFKINDVIPLTYTLNKDNYGVEEKTITVVISERAIKKSSVFSGYSSFNIYAKQNADLNMLDKEIQDNFLDMQGSFVFSNNEDSKIHNKFLNYIIIFTVMTIIITIIYNLIYLTMSIYLNILNKRYEFGVLRSFGLSLNSIKKMLVSNYFISFIVSYIISVFILVFMFGLSEIINNIIIIAGSFVLCLIVLGLSCVLPFRFLNKTTINNMLKNNER